MTLRLLLALLLPLSIGYVGTGIVTPLQRFRLLRICLGVGLGLGISSCDYVLHLLWSAPSGWTLVVAQVGILLVALFVSHRRRSRGALPLPDGPALAPRRLDTVLLAGFIGSALCAAAIFFWIADMLPHGGWDAWAIWNLRARFLFRGGQHWAAAFSHSLWPDHHPEYPLLLPAVVAGGWQEVGEETQIVPVVIAFLFTFATVGLLFSVVSRLRGRTQGALAGLVLLSASVFVILGAYQYADIPIGFFFVACLSLLSLRAVFPESRGLLLLAGIMAGFASFTKNEGMLFLAAIGVAICVELVISDRTKDHLAQTAFFAAGVLLVLPLTFYVKLRLAPAYDPVALQGMHEIAGKLTDGNRYATVIRAFVVIPLKTFPLWPLLVVYPFVAGLRRETLEQSGSRTVLVVLTVMASGYFIVYVITPYDLVWHLYSSLSRLLTALWPTFVFAYFLTVRGPWDSSRRTTTSG